MTGDELKRYRFPETLTNQSRWFGLYLDELIPAVICLGWGFWTSKFIFGIASAVLVFWGIKKLKKGRGSSWLRDLIYWYLPTSLLKGFFHDVPDSCFRQWIKVFPPHAGVIGTTRSEWTPVMSIPPACGGIDIKTAMVGLLLCAPTSRWDFLQSRKVTFFRITHILSNLAGCNQQRPYVDKFMP